MPISADQIATLSVPDLDAAVIEKCKELREVEGRATAGVWRTTDKKIYRGKEGGRHGYREIGSSTKAIWVARFQAFDDDPGEYEGNRQLATLARNSFLAHLDAMEALAGWRCGRCEGTGERTMCGSGQLLPCPSCAPIVTIKREWLGKMMGVGNG